MTAEITEILRRIESGDRAAFDELIGRMYDEMRRIADWHVRRNRVGHTLQSTALVHEAYLKLQANQEPSWENRVHFLSAASRAMRQILVDYARERLAQKRGGDLDREHGNLLEFISAPVALAPEKILSLHEAIDELAKYDERKARIVELRYFGGLSSNEVSEIENLAKRTVEREVKFSLAWLERCMGSEHGLRD